MRQEGESSVEEILESIKKVIARDNREGAADVRRRRQSEGVTETASKADEAEADRAEESEVLDLASAALAAEDNLDDDHDEADFDDDATESLVSERVRNSMQENLAALAMLSEPGMPPQVVRSGETSLEGMVREMLRPMLAQWLDDNLPQMVETMVKAEIARIAGKRG